MNILEKEFTYKKFVFKQIIREGMFAIYEFTDPSWDIKKIYFDTIIIKISPPVTYPNGIFVDFHESYPRDRDYGKFAWCYNNLEQAKKKFNELVENEKNSVKKR